MSPPGPRVARRLSWWTRYGPIVAMEVYLTTSILLFAFGPWIWPARDFTKLYLFVGAAHVALLLGYLTAARSTPRGYFGRAPMRRLLAASIALTLVLYVPTGVLLTGGKVSVLEAVTNPGEVYKRFQWAQENEVATVWQTVMALVRMTLAPVLALLAPLLARTWDALPRWQRVAGVLAVVANLLLFILTGRNKGLVDLLLLLPWLVALYIGNGRVRLRWPRIAVFGGVGAVMLYLFAASFVQNYSQRTGESGADLLGEVSLFGGLKSDPDHVLVRHASPLVRAAFLGLSVNQTHGYYALSMALDKPFRSSWGLGHSAFLQLLAERLTGTENPTPDGYPDRLARENGWHKTVFWHTTYTWFASDVSFPGTLVLVFFLGQIFATTWMDSLRGQNPYALGMFMLVVTIIYYLPTNNIVLGFAEGWTSFWGLLGMWAVTRRRWIWAGARRAPPVLSSAASRPSLPLAPRPA